MEKKEFILEIYKDKRTVFSLPDIATLFPGENKKYLSDRLSYYVRTNTCFVRKTPKIKMSLLFQ
jgi:hypothetical protein